MFTTFTRSETKICTCENQTFRWTKNAHQRWI